MFFRGFPYYGGLGILIYKVSDMDMGSWKCLNFSELKPNPILPGPVLPSPLSERCSSIHSTSSSSPRGGVLSRLSRILSGVPSDPSILLGGGDPRLGEQLCDGKYRDDSEAGGLRDLNPFKTPPLPSSCPPPAPPPRGSRTWSSPGPGSVRP